MNNKRLEPSCRTFHNGLSPFNQIENIHTAVRPVQYGSGKPMTAGFDELVFVQTGTFFPPAFALGHRLYTIENLFSDPRLRTVPLNDFLPVLYIDGARTAIQPETSPIPKLESEDIRSRTDFKHHTVCSGKCIVPAGISKWSCFLTG